MENTVLLRKARAAWHSMRYRISPNKINSRNYAYKDVTICDEWLIFDNFYQWFKENYREGWQIDKDILIKGNRLYCPECCCFVPAFINSLFTKSNKIRGEYPVGVDFHCGRYRARLKKVVNHKRIRIDLGYFDSPEEAFNAYKREREKYFREVAEEYKNILPERVYNAIINYKVEIYD